jgi:hypothetical protein
MTNIATPQVPIPSSDHGRDADPIDALVPPSRRSSRFVAGALVLASVGYLSWQYGSGAIVPRPDCCGSASTGAMMTATPDGQSVTVQALFDNSSRHDLIVESAQAVLPGATVESVELTPTDDGLVLPLPANASTPPVLVPHQGLAQVVVTFVPESCNLPPMNEGGWGSVTLDLAVADNGWLPSFGRRFTLPDPIVLPGEQNLGVFGSDGIRSYDPTDPLDAACALLSR